MSDTIFSNSCGVLSHGALWLGTTSGCCRAAFGESWLSSSNWEDEKHFIISNKNIILLNLLYCAQEIYIYMYSFFVVLGFCGLLWSKPLIWF